MLDALPHRGDGRVRPAGLALPPGPMPRRMGRRPLKRWRYVGVYGPGLMLCAGTVSIAGLRQAFWAVWDREAQRLWERTSMRRAPVTLPDGEVRVADREVVDRPRPRAGRRAHRGREPARRLLHLDAQAARCGRRGLVTLEGRTLAVDAPGLVDDSAGYHARHTAWEWSAGAGIAASGEAVVWNLVAGVHDAPRRSERTVWLDGEPPRSARCGSPRAWTPWAT